MEVIKPLPEDVHSMVRSGFIINCLTTVVEELIYNSLDAGATKVSAYVAVNNGYVKVEDDGCGISRSGLVLLGERYATSKLQHFHENDNFVGSFGFRGEVLCSIADISLLEIVTRVQGRPNGYRKIMKGRKCLCLSIDNDRQAVGTTVIVRDLFYNQPVRRRQMQCSAKKVLHSVKKSAVRIAFVQPKVAFKIIDMESEDELLSTRSCPSPLTLLCSNFGIEASDLLELSFSEGPLRLTGYVSSLSSSCSSKAIQYIYVNSRFIDKGQIHKVLNRLADMCHDRLGGDRGLKKSQPLAPSYCLNLTCPRYKYDLNLEYSRASVEFKDWASVLAFVEKSVMSLWSGEIRRGISHKLEADQIRKDSKENVVENIFSVERDMWLKSCEMSTKRRRTQKSENQHVFNNEALELQVKDFKDFSFQKNNSRQCMNSENITVDFRDIETERKSLHQKGITGARDASHSDFIFDVEDGIDSHLLEPEKGCVNEDFLRNHMTSTKANYSNDCFSSPRRKEEVSMDYQYAGCNEVGSVWSFNFTPKNDSNKVNNDQELFLQSSSGENPLETPLDYGTESQFQIHNFNAKSNFHGNRDADSLSQNFGIFHRSRYESEVANSRPLLKSDMGSCIRIDVDVDHLEHDKSFLSGEGFFDRESPLESLGKRGRILSPYSPTNCGQQTAITYPILKLKDWDTENFIENEGFGRGVGVRNCDDIEQFNYDRDEFCHSGLDDRFSSQNIFSTSHRNTRTVLASEYHNNVETGMWECSPHGHNVDETASIRSESFQDVYSPCMDRRHKDSSFSWSLSRSPKGIEMDLQVGQELGLENIARESSGRTYDSPAGLLTDRFDSMVTNETFSPYLDFQSKVSSFKPSVGCSSAISAGKGPKLDLPRSQVFEPNHSSPNSGCSLRSRSHSAPPFYRGKKKFLSVKSSLTSTIENSALQTASQACTVSERTQSKHPPKLTFSRSINPQGDEIRVGEDSLFCLEQKVKETSNITPVSPWSHNGNADAACLSNGYLMEVQDSESWQTKWREGCPDASSKEIAKYLKAGDRLNDLKDENAILDIQSCMLDLAGDSLVPKSINRNGLLNAKVLWQIDNKYIPVVAGGTLAVIDQHAADERIRLEEMRQKVLSGEMKSIKYLEKEKDLVLPEMAYQLLCNYAEHIKHWGWICNIFCQDSGSFAKNLNILNERASSLTLMAVPCILGVNLSDADLVEYLEQLADTDGSSTIPPAVVRVLNYKACRGAIMFGDKLLPSECSLIVEELKQTSLCFQCAHGRPTTVPLVNLKALHKGILHLRSWHDSSKNTWHGLCRKQITLDRAKRRLNVTRGCG